MFFGFLTVAWFGPGCAFAVLRRLSVVCHLLKAELKLLLILCEGSVELLDARNFTFRVVINLSEVPDYLIGLLEVFAICYKSGGRSRKASSKCSLWKKWRVDPLTKSSRLRSRTNVFR